MTTNPYKQLIKEVTAVVHDLNKTKSHIYQLHSIPSVLSRLAGEYYWLPVMNIFKEARLLDKNLMPSPFMFKNRFAVEAFDTNYHLDCESFFITCIGEQFLRELLVDIN